MKITFLGTNGWYDTKTGNTICTLIETKDYFIILQSLDKTAGAINVSISVVLNPLIMVFVSIVIIAERVKNTMRGRAQIDAHGGTA